jgi:hypothetical protein
VVPWPWTIVRALSVAALVLVTTVSAGAEACRENGRRVAAVDLEIPGPIELLGVTVAVDYPRDRVVLPDGDATKTRIAELPADHMSSITDTDGTLRVALAHATKTIGRGRLFEIEFTRCEGTRPPAAADLRCRVQSAAQETGALLEGVTCTTVVEGDK